MTYRSEIDGLRAMAVIPVILYHAGFNSFRGGFVGVDVFFVISGYLITTILLNDLEAGTFSLIHFYERRARRILPALFFVMFACLPFAWIWLMPQDMKSFSKSLYAVSVFLSNILFFRESGYFDPAIELKPLIHTWSLAVEEQYYLLFPLLLLFMWKFGKQRIVAMLLVIAVISLAAAQWGSVNRPEFTFYMLPTRAFELMIGAFIALFYTGQKIKKQNQVIAESGSMLGVLLIAYAVFVFSERTPFPSLYALVPTLGAALIIVFATHRTLAGRVLGSKLFMGVGLISYSAYLWHQPLFAFARYRSFEEPDIMLMSALTVAAIVLAYFSWRFVERPFRNKHRFTRRQVFLFSAVCSLCFITVGVTGQLTKGFPGRLTDEQRAVISFEQYDYKKLYSYRVCMMDPKQKYTEFDAICRGNGKEDSVLVWGDSHAAALSVGLRKEVSNLMQYTASGCPPLKDAIVSWRPECRAVNEHVMDLIRSTKPGRIFLHANWISYKEQDPVFEIHKTIDYIRGVSPSSIIVIVGGVPQYKPSLPGLLTAKYVKLDGIHHLKSPIYHDLLSQDESFRKVADKKHVRFFSALNVFCPADKCQVTTELDNVWMPTAWDYAHLTEGGSLLLARKLLEE